MLYGDNTEFRNPFREGETIFGAAVRPALEIAVNPRVTITLGALGNQRFGSDEAFDLVRPVVSASFRGAHSAFLIGTLPGPPETLFKGPDRGGPHGLLPPLQRETLTFERPYEAGMLWTVTTRRLQQAAWINWPTRPHTASGSTPGSPGRSGPGTASRCRFNCTSSTKAVSSSRPVPWRTAQQRRRA
jgi:hypothetical protein